MVLFLFYFYIVNLFASLLRSIQRYLSGCVVGAAAVPDAAPLWAPGAMRASERLQTGAAPGPVAELTWDPMAGD
jgi:murein endopeptidase